MAIIETNASTSTRSRSDLLNGRVKCWVRQLILPAIAWLLLCGIWSATWLFLRLGVRDFPPLTFAWVRGVIAASALGLIVGARRPKLPRELRDWGLMAITGLLVFAVNYLLLSWPNNLSQLD